MDAYMPSAFWVLKFSLFGKRVLTIQGSKNVFIFLLDRQPNLIAAVNYPFKGQVHKKM